MTRWRLARGAQGERLAADYLTRLGYRIELRNYRCRLGEIDIVAWDGAVLVFVEVRTRRGEDLGALLESVNQRKQHRIARVALAYVQAHRIRDTVLRFDVVAVTCPADRPPEITHVPAAFDAAPQFLY